LPECLRNAEEGFTNSCQMFPAMAPVNRAMEGDQQRHARAQQRGGNGSQP
jgi:hypothetical protein